MSIVFFQFRASISAYMDERTTTQKSQEAQKRRKKQPKITHHLIALLEKKCHIDELIIRHIKNRSLMFLLNQISNRKKSIR